MPCHCTCHCLHHHHCSRRQSAPPPSLPSMSKQGTANYQEAWSPASPPPPLHNNAKAPLSSPPPPPAHERATGVHPPPPLLHKQARERRTMPRHPCPPRRRLVIAPASKGLPTMARHRRPPRRQLVIKPVSEGWPTMPRHPCPHRRQLVVAQASKGMADNAASLPPLSFTPPPLPLPSVCAYTIVSIQEGARDGQLSQSTAVGPPDTAIAQ